MGVFNWRVSRGGVLEEGYQLPRFLPSLILFFQAGWQLRLTALVSMFQRRVKWRRVSA
jgi:hypothetical protein